MLIYNFIYLKQFLYKIRFFEMNRDTGGNCVFRFFIIVNCPATPFYLLSVCLIKLLLEFLLFNIFVYDLHNFFVCLIFLKFINITHNGLVYTQPFQ